MFFSRFLKRQNLQKQRALTEKVDHIEKVVATLPDTLDKLHADMWSQLAHLSEQAAQRPGIVLASPLHRMAILEAARQAVCRFKTMA